MEWLVERAGEVVDVVPLTVFVGTWNVNGGKNMHNIAFRNQAPLTEWLFPNEQLSKSLPKTIGFMSGKR